MPKPPCNLLRPFTGLTLQTPYHIPSEPPMSFYEYVKQLIVLNKKQPHLLSVANVEQAWKDQALMYYRKRPNRFAIATKPASMEGGWEELARYRSERERSTSGSSVTTSSVAAPGLASRAAVEPHGKPLNIPYHEGDLPSDYSYERFLDRLRRCNSGADVGRAQAWRAADVFVERLRARIIGGRKRSTKTLQIVEHFAKNLAVQEDKYWRGREAGEGKGERGG